MYMDNLVSKKENSHSIIVIKETESTESSKLQLLTPPLSSDTNLPVGVIIPPHLPRMFLDLLIPIKGLKNKKLPYDCSLCGEMFATWNSLVTHNKSHLRPACLACGIVVTSVSKLALHMSVCHEHSSVVITSKYGRSRPVKSYLATLK